MRPPGALRRRAAALIDAHGNTHGLARSLAREFPHEPLEKIYAALKNERKARGLGKTKAKAQVGAIVFRMAAEDSAALRAEAERRGVSAYRLTATLISILLRDQMIDAILDGELS